MTCQVTRKEGEIVSVKDAKGNESKLFSEIKAHIPDSEQALKEWAIAYTPSFEKWSAFKNLSLIPRKLFYP